MKKIQNDDMHQESLSGTEPSRPEQDELADAVTVKEIGEQRVKKHVLLLNQILTRTD